MLVGGAIGGAEPAVAGAIRNAASATGTNFEYLLATARVESGFNPNASAKTSSAQGLFQFIDRTWLSTLKQAGPTLGYGKYAAAISQDQNGQLSGLRSADAPEDHGTAPGPHRQCRHGRRVHAHRTRHSLPTSSAAAPAKANFTWRIFSAPTARRD